MTQGAALVSMDDRAGVNPERSSTAAPTATPFAFWILIYFLSGFVAIGLEILWFRLLDVSVKSSAYTFGTLLAVYLSCLAVGSLVGARRQQRIFDPTVSYLRIQCGVIILALLPLLLLVHLPDWFIERTWLFQYWSDSNPLYPSRERWLATITLYVFFPLCVMGASTFAMGYSFAALQKGVQSEAIDSGYRVGVLQAANIVGCVLGSLVVGLWWLQYFGTAASLQILAVFSATFAMLGILITSQRTHFAIALATIACVTWLLPSNQGLWLRLHGQSRASVMVVAEDVSGIAAAAPEDASKWRVSANGKSQSSLPFGGFHAKLGALPSTLHPKPESIAIIGLGSGNTAWAAACRAEETRSIKVFEVCTAELPLLSALAASGSHPQLANFLSDSRLSIIGRDARHALMTSAEEYDIIETDAIRPHSAYAGYLYSIEFFELCRSRLKSGGLMCCWSPTQGTFSTFRQVFPYMVILDNGYLLIGSKEPISIDKAAWKSTVERPGVAGYLGPDVTNECLMSIENVTTDAEQFSIPMINTDLFPFDEFH